MAINNVNLPLGNRGIFLPAWEWLFPNGTWTLTRAAAGDYYMLKTAAAATTNPAVNISKAIKRILAASPNAPSVNSPFGGELQEGGIFTGFDLIYNIGTADLTSLTPTLYETLYQNNTADAVATPSTLVSYPTSGVATLVKVQTLNYVTKFALASPYIIGKNYDDVSDWLELAVVDAGTTVFALYGVMLKFNANR